MVLAAGVDLLFDIHAARIHKDSYRKVSVCADMNPTLQLVDDT